MHCLFLRISKNINFLFSSRFVAVHYPLDYNQSANDVGALKIRIMKFMLPVVGLAFMFNTTKFFEAKYTYSEYSKTL